MIANRERSVSRWLKRFLFGVWALLLIPLVAILLEKWHENLFSGPDAVATAVSDLVRLGQQRWFEFAVALSTGAVIGASLESLTRKSDEKKAYELRSLGFKFCSLSDNIKNRTASPGWPGNVHDLRPAMTSAFASGEKFDLW